eukprot:SAG31_NODE_4569_length_3128_cov_53.221525_3_plen_58_part_00
MARRQARVERGDIADNNPAGQASGTDTRPAGQASGTRYNSHLGKPARAAARSTAVQL